MKLVVFSDLHGNALALEEMIKILPNMEYDKIAFLGDVFGYYYCQDKCLELLRKIPNLIWLKGNHEQYAINAYNNRTEEDRLVRLYGHSFWHISERFHHADMERLDVLSSSMDIIAGSTKVGLFHGRPSDPLEGRIYNDTILSEEEFAGYDIVIFGHTHCKIDRMVGTTRIISPGSLGMPRDGKGYGFAMLDLDSGELTYINVAVDSSILKTQITQNDPGLRKLFDVLGREYNYETKNGEKANTSYCD